MSNVDSPIHMEELKKHFDFELGMKFVGTHVIKKSGPLILILIFSNKGQLMDVS